MDKEFITAIGNTLKRPVDTVCTFIESLLGPAVKGVGSILGDQVAMWQWTNRIRIAEKAERLVDKNKASLRVLPNSFLIPLLRESGDVDDENLQDAWAQLLAASIEDDVAQHTGFVHLLKQLVPIDAQVIRSMLQVGFCKDDEERTQAISDNLTVSAETVKVSLANLERLRIIALGHLTSFGSSFLRVCFPEKDSIDAYQREAKERGRHYLTD